MALAYTLRETLRHKVLLRIGREHGEIVRAPTLTSLKDKRSSARAVAACFPIARQSSTVLDCVGFERVEPDDVLLVADAVAVLAHLRLLVAVVRGGNPSCLHYVLPPRQTCRPIAKSRSAPGSRGSVVWSRISFHDEHQDRLGQSV